MLIGPTDSELQQMRADAEASMPLTAVIRERTLADDASGGQTAMWVTERGATSCRLALEGKDKPAVIDSLNGGLISPAERFVLSLPYGTEIEETDHVIIDSAEFEIVSIITPRSYAVSERLLVKRYA